MKRFVVSTLVPCLVVSAAFGSLYSWNPKKRVPIPLRDALDRAEALLGDDANNRYCVAVILFGNKEGDGKGGAWNLFYAAEDGSKKLVHISMDGTSRVTLWNGPTDRTQGAGRRTDLDDVRERLAKLFADNKIDAQVQQTGNSLTVRYKTRSHKTYAQTEDGEYTDILSEVIGPKANGFVIDVSVVTKFVRGWHSGYPGTGPYWREYKRIHLTATKNTFLKVEVLYGGNVNHEFANELFGVFGVEARNL